MSESTGQPEVKSIAVGDLFSESADTYSIPLYQRNYTWGEEQIHRLVYDILDEAEQDKPNDYFLGNLVVAPPAQNTDHYDVIDGQQRLTTLYILLARLARREKSIGQVSPPIYEGREKATRALRGLAQGSSTPSEDGEQFLDSGIVRATIIIDQLLEGEDAGQRLRKDEVLKFLLKRVRLVRMPIDRTTDLNRYFEIMNTRGTQLSPVDIVKARLLRHLSDPAERDLFNRVWTACSDMDHYVAMTITPGDTVQRSKVFGSDWDQLPTADFERLREQLSYVHVEDSYRGAAGEPSGSGTTARTLDEAIDDYSRSNSVAEDNEDGSNERFTSQITFPTFLLHVLAVRNSGQTASGRQDRELDDKQLIEHFSGYQDGPAANNANWVRQFTTDLLRIRHLFDQYILKRDAAAASGTDSTTDEEPGSWSLYRLKRGTSAGRESALRYSPTFSGEENASGEGGLQQKILLLQSALRITYTSPRTMHWMTEALRYVTETSDRGESITASGYLECLESYARRRVRDAMTPDPDDPKAVAAGMPLGFGIQRIVFTYLDYLLVENLNRWDFTFSYRTSIEHFSPQTPDQEHGGEKYRIADCELLDWFGNLALVTVSANSKFSNYLPAQKATNQAARNQSLKLDLMAQQAEERWRDEDIRAHHEEMKAILKKALANGGSQP